MDYIHKGIKKENGRLLAGLGILCYTRKHGTYSVLYPQRTRTKRSLRNGYVTCPKCLDMIVNKIMPSTAIYNDPFYSYYYL